MGDVRSALPGRSFHAAAAHLGRTETDTTVSIILQVKRQVILLTSICDIVPEMLLEWDGIVGSGIQQILKIQHAIAAKLRIILLRLCKNSLACFPEPTLIFPVSQPYY